MKTIDTRKESCYSPLIPAITAFCRAEKGDSMEIIMDNEHAFRDLKEFLAEQEIGFREIYDGEEFTVEFTK